MFTILPCLLKDGYKAGHIAQYPDDTQLIYSNMTARKSRIPNTDGVVFFGMQYFIQEYLIRQFNENFFQKDRDAVVKQYKRRMDNYLGPDAVNPKHIGELHELGFLPLRIKALPEGTLVPFRVPSWTVRNTQKEFFWLTNMLETLESNVLWLPSTSATTALRYRRVFQQYAKRTGGDLNFVPWQGHDFSFRGMAGVEAAVLSGAAHLLFFTGTDTIPAIDFLEQYYHADCEKELIGGSVPATEHSVMSMGSKEGELETIKRLITKVYPKGIVSIVCDTWDFWNVVTEILPALKNEIMSRDGKVVIRPDSGDPVQITCGDGSGYFGVSSKREKAISRGAIESFWETFGGTVTSTGHRLLDSHIGLIYGDSITQERQVAILEGLAQKKFASTNPVLGIGSFTYNYVTRDTYGFGMKATYGETESEGGKAIYKDPLTDDGTKKSARGLLHVSGDPLTCTEDCTWDQERLGDLRTVFVDGRAANAETLSGIRARVVRLYDHT